MNGWRDNLIGPVQPAEPRLFLKDYTSTFIKVYGIHLGHVQRRWSGMWIDLIYDLEYIYNLNSYPLIQKISFVDDTILGDITKQSLVHFRIGVLGNGEQKRIEFYFTSLPNSPLKVQFFVDENLEDQYYIDDVDEEIEHDNTILVTGDGSTIKDVYLRPINPDGGAGADYPVLLFDGAQIVED